MKCRKYVRTGNAVVTILFVVLSVCLLIFFSFKYPFSFNYEIDLNDQYYLVWTIPVVTLLLLLLLIFNKWNLNIEQALYLLGVSVVCLYLLLSKHYYWGNEHFFVIAAIALIMGLVLFVKGSGCIYYLLLLLCLLFLYEFYTGYAQYSDAVDYNGNTGLAIKGSFQNSGVFAMYLVTQLPILYFVLVESGKPHLQAGVVNSKQLRFIIYLVILAATVFLVYKTQSRTAYIAFIVTAAGWLWFKYGQILLKLLKRISVVWLAGIAVTGVGFLIVTGYYLFTMKKMSALGRIMKIEITREHIMDDFWCGTGLGRFTWYYPQWQAGYFAVHPDPVRSYFLSAGESYIIFNEPLQLLRETGLIGFLILIGLLVYFFRIKSADHRQLLTCLKLVMVSTIAASFTSYPLHVNYLLCLFFFCFFTAVAVGAPGPFSSLRKAAQVLLCRPVQFFLLISSLVLLTVISFKSIPVFNAFGQWQQLKWNAIQTGEAIDTYSALKNRLGKDGKFLTDYGTVLLEAGRTGEAVAVLEEATTWFISVRTMEQLAEAYFQNRQPGKAIEIRKWLCNFLPNRFGQKQELLKLYQAVGDSVNTRHVAQIILTMPVKIPSMEVERIKAAAEKVLK